MQLQTNGTVRAVRDFDVLIVGAGLSGISAAVHLRRGSPGKSFAILERRDAIGGTWDLFRYPGVRSDSDMATLGFSFRPWLGEKAITSGESIREYIRDTARDEGVEGAIRFGCDVRSASWSSTASRWTLRVAEHGDVVTYTCAFLFMCSGYYDYQTGYTPEWPGVENYRGKFVHPQFWPENLDMTGKSVVVIGSGATAVTLIPEIAKVASHVTMLQRSPTYIVSRPAKDVVADWLHRLLPSRIAHSIVRWKNVLFTIYVYGLSRRRPDRVKNLIISGARQALGPDYDVATHFTPKYNPWDQRLCLVPDGDLFAAIRTGKASVVTDRIASFTPDGIRLESGNELQADVVVSATGLKVQLMGGMQLEVDGKPADLGKTLGYKGMMFSGVPNFAYALGYTNASWTLKCELTSRYVSRLINYMDEKGYAFAMPRRPSHRVPESPALGLTSGYVQRAVDVLPKQGDKTPWRLHQNYAVDRALLRLNPIADEHLVFYKRKIVKAPR